MDTNSSSPGTSTDDYSTSSKGDACGGCGYLGSDDEAIAIVGIGLRLPGDVADTSSFWDMLISGKSGHGDTPSSRFNAEGFYHPNADRPGCINSKGGYFLSQHEDVRSFDNGFFGINNLEAKHMDPQQRKLLEVVYESFESAGASLESVSGANIGCYVANFVFDFFNMQSKDPDNFTRYSATGMGNTILANRINHVFNLKGPSFVVDTACSSSLYCLHLACAALEAGECDSAVVAGANLILSPESHMGATKAGILSGTSTCHTFDSSADGYGRAEGVASLYLKKLSDAIRDGDPIRSVIRSHAVNSNGKTNGISLPSASGQEAVMRKAYQKARLSFYETEYIEAHGTGTQVGDPIEVDAISRVFTAGREKGSNTTSNQMRIGSVKTNVGHSEAVSGITSVIKMTLALEHGIIPPTIGIRNLNPNLKLDERNLRIITSPEPFKNEFPRVGVNSFGYGGANAHVVMESAKLHQPLPSSISSRSATTCLVPISAHNETSLQLRLEDLSKLDTEKIDLRDLAYTCSRRSHQSIQGVLVTRNETFRDDLAQEKIVRLGPSKNARRLPIGFVFTGQGAQWPGMGSHLMREYPAFLQTIKSLDLTLSHLSHAPSWTIEDAILADADSSQLHTALQSQAVCTGLQLALIQLLREWNIVPKVVVGHSSGEIAAAVAAGHISVEEGIVIAYYRGLVVSQSRSSGAMMAVGLTADEFKSKLAIPQEACLGSVEVACINSPKSITVSGDEEAIEFWSRNLQESGVFARKLRTDNKAYHSAHMRALGEQYEKLLIDAGIGTRNKTLPRETLMFSSLTSGIVTQDQTNTASYWRSNLESPVLFQGAMEGLMEHGAYHLIELGPHSALELPIKQISSAKDDAANGYIYSSALSRNKDSVVSLLRTIGALFLHGHPISIDEVNRQSDPRFPVPPPPRLLTDLPKYRWANSEPLWYESRLSSEFRNRCFPRHDLLGSRTPGGSDVSTEWRNVLRIRDVPYLEDHKLGDQTILPAAAYLAMAIEALTQLQPASVSEGLILTLSQVHLLQALVLPQQDGIEIFTQLKAKDLTGRTSYVDHWDFKISSHQDGKPILHATGTIGFKKRPQVISNSFRKGIPMREQAKRTWYQKFSSEGVVFGPRFESLDKIQNTQVESLPQTSSTTALLRGGGESNESSYLIHPITIDALIQTGGMTNARGSVDAYRGNIPVGIDLIQLDPRNLARDGDTCTIQAVTENSSFGSMTVYTEMLNPQNQPTLQISGLRLVPLMGYKSLQAKEQSHPRHPLLRICWKPDISKPTFGQEQWKSYHDQFLDQMLTKFPSTDVASIAAALDLITHKHGASRILDLNDQNGSITRNSMSLLGADELRRFNSYTCAHWESETLIGSELLTTRDPEDEKREDIEISPETRFDAIVLSATVVNPDNSEALSKALQFLAADGYLVVNSVGPALDLLDCSRFSKVLSTTSDTGTCTTILKAINEPSDVEAAKLNRDIVIVDSSQDHLFGDMLDKCLRQLTDRPEFVQHINFGDLKEGSIPNRALVVATMELESHILAGISDEGLSKMRIITKSAAELLWITAGGMLKAENPFSSIILGVSRSLGLEQPSLKFGVLDVEMSSAKFEKTFSNIQTIIQDLVREDHPDLEYLQHDGIPYCSRFLPDREMNDVFREKADSATVPMKLSEAGGCRLSIKEPGQFDTIHFVQDRTEPAIPSNYVEIEVKSVGVNAKDVYALSGRVQTKNSACALECTGIITRVGSEVTRYTPGQRVIAMAPLTVSTYEQVPEWACCPLLDTEDLESMSTLAGVFCSAIYAIRERANLRPGETILIHSAAGGLGIAAIQIAKLLGATPSEIFATVGTEEKRRFLVDNFGLRPDQIFDSRSSSFLSDLMDKTNGHGVDVVINSLTGPLLHDSWKACAEFGRFVEVGKKDILEDGRLEMQQFRKCVTFTAFDFDSLCYSSSEKQHRIRQKLLEETVQLLREGKIQHITPLKVFDVSEIQEAYRYFQRGSRIGKVCISFGNPSASINVVRAKYQTTFSPDKVYFLVGCLGGLGRSISKWMISQGAKKLAFLGRSGLARPSARDLVEDLRRSNVEVNVIKGDVSCAEDVTNAIRQIQGPIGGVIHAAMDLDEVLFDSMSAKSWHTSIDPKVWGTWNIHNALEGHDADLDFFLMTSSMTGSVGVATESNYCAANSFQDAFARYRRRLGLPGTALGIGMVKEIGYLHEHPQIETWLLRKGLHPFSESELIRIIDISLSNQTTLDIPQGESSYMEGHLLMGLETLGLQRQRKLGFEGDNHALYDPRSAAIANTLEYVERFEASSEGGTGTGSSDDTSKRIRQILKAKDKGQQLDTQALETTIISAITKKLCHLLLLQPDQLSPTTQLGNFGMDSMLAAEFRTFIFTAIGADISFQILLEKETTTESLTKLAMSGLGVEVAG